MEIPVLIHKSRGGDALVAFCPDLPGCSATAATESEALARLRQRVADYFAHDTTFPLPPGARRAVIHI